MLTYLMVARVAQLCPGAVLTKLDKLVEPLKLTVTTKVSSSIIIDRILQFLINLAIVISYILLLFAPFCFQVKANSVKQEYEKQDELKRSAMRAVAALMMVPGAGN